MLLNNNDNEISPSKDSWQMVEFTISNPSASPVSINLFDVTAPPILPQSPNTLPPTVVDASVSIASAWASAVCPVNNSIYVTGGGGDVSVINTSSYLITSTIPVQGVGIAYNPVSNTMYIVGTSSGLVYVVSCATNTVIATIPVSGYVVSIAYNTINNRMYVGAYNITIDVIDCATNTVLTIITLPVGTECLSLAYNPYNNSIYAPNSGGGNVYVIACATNTISATIAVDNIHTGICYNTVYNRMYVVSQDAEAVYVIDCATNTVVGSPIPVGSTPVFIALTPLNNLAYVTNALSNNISVIDCSVNTVVNTITSIPNPFDIAYSSLNNSMIITSDAGVAPKVIVLVPLATISVISSSFDYNQFVSDAGVNPKVINQIVLISTSAQLNNNIQILKKDMYGNRYSDWKYPNLKISKYMNQNSIVEIKFDKKENLILDAYSSFSQYQINGETSLTMLLYYKEAILAERLNKNGRIATGTCLSLQLSNCSQNPTEKKASEINNFGETVLTMEDILKIKK